MYRMGEKKTAYPKPFLKWVGGKSQIIDDIMKHFPSEINNYHEIFLGGGSVLFALLYLRENHKITIDGSIKAYDANPALIHLYKCVQNDNGLLFEMVTKYRNEYDSIEGTSVNRKPKCYNEGKTSKESYYYWVRSEYNNTIKTTSEAAAMFLFLNKTCFRGLYREGPNGFNVPYGHYKRTPSIVTRDDLNSLSKLIQDVVFECCDFSDSLNHITKGDFVYLAPPYAPTDATSFVSYTNGGFDVNCHKRLFSKIKQLHSEHIKFSMSNAKVELVTECFEGLDVHDIVAKRAINSKNPGSTVTEVIVSN